MEASADELDVLAEQTEMESIDAAIRVWLFLIIVIFIFVTYICYLHISKEIEAARRGLSHRDWLVEPNRTHKFDPMCGDVDDCCSVCLDTLSGEDLLRTLSCSHTFHAQCIDQWLLSYSSQCPMCRAQVVKRTA